MASDYTSIPDGMVLIATLVFWSFALDWLGYHVRVIQRFVRPAPLLLVRDGRMLRRHMRQELITEDELMSQLRLQGTDDLAEVKEARMEGDGRISVITRDRGSQGAPDRAGV